MVDPINSMIVDHVLLNVLQPNSVQGNISLDILSVGHFSFPLSPSINNIGNEVAHSWKTIQ